MCFTFNKSRFAYGGLSGWRVGVLGGGGLEYPKRCDDWSRISFSIYFIWINLSKQSTAAKWSTAIFCEREE